MRRVDVQERRARLARRHAVRPGDRAADVLEAARRMVCLHATDPATIAISAFQRVDGLTVADVERALYVERSLVKHLAMRRTLFVFPRAALPLAQAGVSDRVASNERRKVIKDAEAAGLQADGAAWLDTAGEAVVAALAGGREETMAGLRAEIPLLAGTMTYGEGRSWGGTMPFAPRVLTWLSAQGRIVRATNDGRWTLSRPRWALMDEWLGAPLERLPEADGVRGLVELWLRAFGPGTERDIKWWLGSTLKAVRGALAELAAVEVDLDGDTGYLLADDLEPVAAVEPWAALLPPLDPTTMGWTERAWYLGPYKQELFDTAGNAGPTVWWEGRIVGGWRQRADGTVELQLLEAVGADALAAIEHEAERLEAWLGRVRVLPRFPSPLSRALA